jgi:hypothetical protein
LITGRILGFSCRKRNRWHRVAGSRSIRKRDLGRWKEELDRLLASNAKAAARERPMLIRLFEELRAFGCDGGYDAVQKHLWRASIGRVTLADQGFRHALGRQLACTVPCSR